MPLISIERSVIMSQENNLYIDRFLNYMQGIKRCSETTLKSYKNNLIYLFDYLYKNKIINITDITEEHIEGYLATCNAERTFNQRLSTFKHFFKWAKKKGYIKLNPAIEIDSVQTQRINPKYLNENEKTNLTNCIEGKFTKRDLAIVMLLLNGLRRTEVAQVRIRNIKEESVIDKETGEWKKANVLSIKGKGNKERIVVLYPETYQAIQDYLDCNYRKYYKDKEVLFLTQDGKELSSSAIAKQTKKYLEKINKGDYSCHKLRHTYATLLYKKTRNLLLVQNQLGHESISTTEIYTHLDMNTIIDDILELKTI